VRPHLLLALAITTPACDASLDEDGAGGGKADEVGAGAEPAAPVVRLRDMPMIDTDGYVEFTAINDAAPGVRYVLDMANAEAASTYDLRVIFASYPSGTDLGDPRYQPTLDPVIGAHGAALVPGMYVSLYDLARLPPEGCPSICEAPDALIASYTGEPAYHLLDVAPSDAGARFAFTFPTAPSGDVYLIRTQR
jgi:hypothetical protein